MATDVQICSNALMLLGEDPIAWAIGRQIALAVVCLECHQGAHKGDKRVLSKAWLWAMRHQYLEAMKDIDRRLAKKAASRAKGDGR